MPTFVPARGAILERVLQSTHPLWSHGLTRQAYARFDGALLKTAWGRTHQRRVALVEGAELLATATEYELAAVLDRRAVRVCGIGAIFTETAHRGRGHAHRLIEHVIEDATRGGASVALLFSDVEPTSWERCGFERVPIPAVELTVAQTPRHGAPMALVRSGEERDLAAIVGMGRVRAEPFRFHLDRDIDRVQYAITRTRLLAGLGPADARQVHFFIAEEGITAAAYVVLTVIGDAWTVEECGDRDPSGARVGALLQALIARQPGERRPVIRGWLPPGFVPPQVTLTPATPSTAVLMVRALEATTAKLGLSADDVLYWRNDIV